MRIFTGNLGRFETRGTILRRTHLKLQQHNTASDSGEQDRAVCKRRISVSLSRAHTHFYAILKIACPFPILKYFYLRSYSRRRRIRKVRPFLRKGGPGSPLPRICSFDFPLLTTSSSKFFITLLTLASPPASRPLLPPFPFIARLQFQLFSLF